MPTGKGSTIKALSTDEITDVLFRGLQEAGFDGQKGPGSDARYHPNCAITVDGRLPQRVFKGQSGPVGFHGRSGTHPPLSDEAIRGLYGLDKATIDREFTKSSFLNHRWDLSDVLVRLGRLEPETVAEATGGLYRQGVDVAINKAVFEYDRLIILGPVFPHEVVGFSGGVKYFFPAFPEAIFCIFPIGWGRW